MPKSDAPTPAAHDALGLGPIAPLYDASTLAERIAQLGQEITKAYRGKDLVIVGVLKGSFVFFADLARHIDLPLTCEFIGISSYGRETKSSGIVQLTHDVQHSVAGRDVLLVEDIIDSGLSMRYLIDSFMARRPKSLKVCTLLHKPSGAKVAVPIDFKGFVVPDAFVVGYGLDYLGRLRNLPFIGSLSSEQANAFKKTFESAPYVPETV